MAETLDKLEEDVLEVFSASIRGPRKAIVTFGDPIRVEAGKKTKTMIPDLTHSLEQAVQEQLDSIVL